MILAIAGAVALGGCVEPNQPSEDMEPDIDPAPPGLVATFDALSAGRTVLFETTHGDVRLVLYDQWMPRTTARFGELVAGGFYDGTLVHRVVDDFVIQGGDPSGTGSLGSGQTIDFESHPDLLFGAGAMGLARDVDPDSGDSQWFITEKPAPHLSDPNSSTAATFGTYALYGQVIEGMDIVRSIASEPVLPGLDRPVQDVILERATLTGPSSGISYLDLPPAIAADLEVGSYIVDVERPFHVFSGRPFPSTIYVAAVEDVGAPASVSMDCGDAGNATYTPHDADRWVFWSSFNITHPGPHTCTLLVDEFSSSLEWRAWPWHPDLARYEATDG